MNPFIITILVIGSLAAIITSFFVADYLNQRFIERYFVKRKLAQVNQEAIRAELRNEIRGDIAFLPTQVSNLEQRVERIERQLNKIFKPALPGI